MAERKTNEQRLKELEEKEKKLSQQKKALLAKMASDERKKRTHRLIEIGATVEKVFGDTIEKEMIPRLERFLKMNH